VKNGSIHGTIVREGHVTMRARILMFGWEFPPHNSGGLGVACQGLVRALSKQGVGVTFVLPRKFSTDFPYARIVFAEVDGVPTRVINSPLVGYVTSDLYGTLAGTEAQGMYGSNLIQEVLRYAQLARRLASNESFDVIYAHDWLAFPAGIEAKRLTGKPLIVHVHATEFDRCGGPAGVNRDVYEIERAGMEAADRVIAVSELTKRTIVTHYGIPEDKVRVVYNGIDDDTAPQAGGGRMQLAAMKDAGYSLVLFLGRITLQKGPDYFLRAAKRVLDENPNVIFIMSGSGDMERQIMEMSAQLDISQNVFFSGFLRGSELYEAYRLADLFVMPSVSEPFGIAALEAMKTGTPVLISKQSGVSEVVRHALKADFWDVDEMANQILSVVSYPPLSKTLSEHAAREAQHLSWANAADKINHIVHELVP
jgi:glycosyltransferase involved in cell wall biosynthesis